MLFRWLKLLRKTPVPPHDKPYAEVDDIGFRAGLAGTIVADWEWREIEKIEAFRRVKPERQEIVIEFVRRNDQDSFRFTDDSSGFLPVISKMHQIFPEIRTHWHSFVANTPKPETIVLLFSRASSVCGDQH